jgi:hypothetical protein
LPTPLESPNKASLITRLRAEKGSLAEWFDGRYDDAESIVQDSVGSNTFRAFRKPPPPSKVFRTWANLRLSNAEVVEQIITLRSEEEYDQWLKDFSKDLAKYWNRKMGPERRMPYGPGRRLTNLLMKRVVLWNRLDDLQRFRLIGYLHIPFD